MAALPHDAMTAAAEPSSLPEMLGGMIEAAMALAGADFGSIQLVDADGRLRIVAQRGFPDWWIEYWATVASGHGACGTSLFQDERVIVEDVEQSPIFAGTPALDIQRKAGVRAVQSTPLRDRSGQVLGMLSTHCRVPCRPDARTLQLLDLLAAHAATLIERERAERALSERDAQYRAVVEASADGFWMLDEQGRIVAVNDVYARRSGYSREELLAMGVADIEAEETAEAARRHMDKVRSQGADLFETAHRAKSGEVWPVEINVSYRPEAGGKYFAFIRDISGRKRLEAELRLGEERFRLAMDAAVEGIWDWNLENGEVYYSPGYAAMLGYAPGDIRPDIGAWLDLMPPDDAETVFRAALRLLGESGHYALEFRLRRRDGGYSWVLSRGKVVERDAAGKPRRAIGTHMDITERKRAMRALEDARNMQAEAQRIAHLGSFEYVVATRATVWSEEEYRIFGLDPAGPSPTYEEMLARCIHPEDAERLHGSFVAAMERAEIYELEYRIIRPDGSVRWARDLAHPYFDEQGKLLRYVGTTLDITERKRQEEATQRHSELMQSMVRQQVAVQTAAAFAHELNQPLVSIAAYNEVALRALGGGQARADQLVRAVEGSHAQALRAGRVLHALIDQLHKGEAEFEPFDLNRLVEDVVAKMRTVEFRSFQTTLDLEAGLPAVLGNRLQTEKVLLNLMQNGLEAMAEAGMTTTSFAISVRSLAGHAMAQVTVRDSGPGLEADSAGRIFEPFFSTKPNGLGLGLAISRSLVEAQNGRLWADPAGGPGAAFHFTLPFAHECD